MHYAAQRGQLEIVEKLLAGNARNATRDCFGVSPAHYAAQGGYLRVVSRILASAGGTVRNNYLTDYLLFSVKETNSLSLIEC